MTPGSPHTVIQHACKWLLQNTNFSFVLWERSQAELCIITTNVRAKKQQRLPTEASGPLLRKVAEIVEKSRLHVRTDRTRVQKGPTLTDSSAITLAALWASLGWSPSHQEVPSKQSLLWGDSLSQRLHVISRDFGYKRAGWDFRRGAFLAWIQFFVSHRCDQLKAVYSVHQTT